MCCYCWDSIFTPSWRSPMRIVIDMYSLFQECWDWSFGRGVYAQKGAEVEVPLWEKWQGEIGIEFKRNWNRIETGNQCFLSRYSSPAPREGPRAKSTSWRSTNPGWPTGSPHISLAAQDSKVQYLRKWPKSDPSCLDGLESGHHLLFCPRISFKGLGSILGPGDLWPLVHYYCDGWAQATTVKMT